MAELFPTPAACAAALEQAGFIRKRPLDVIGKPGSVIAIVPRTLPDTSTGCSPVLVTVTSAGDESRLQTRNGGKPVEQYAVVPNPHEPETRAPEPLLYWSPAEPEIVDHEHRDRVHEGMPADPFGETPELAAHATDATELMLIMGTYIDAGFTRDEAFKLVRDLHLTELDHAAQHCLVEHQAHAANRDEGEGG